MPTYDYRCELTGNIYEARHPMALKLSNWQDLCDVTGMEPGETPLDSPITKLLTTGGVVKSNPLKSQNLPPCMTGGGCSGGGCGI